MDEYWGTYEQRTFTNTTSVEELHLTFTPQIKGYIPVGSKKATSIAIGLGYTFIPSLDYNPGISGSFVLVLLGKYAYIIDAVGNLDWIVLIVFTAGAIIGILAFSHAFSWLLKRAYNGTIMFLAGLMLGSLVKLWPWKKVIEEVGKVAVDHPVWPAQFSGESHIAGAVIWALAGCALIVVVEFASASIKKRSASDAS